MGNGTTRIKKAGKTGSDPACDDLLSSHGIENIFIYKISKTAEPDVGTIFILRRKNEFTKG